MYRYSVNLSIAHYPRWNSIAAASAKPVFVITRVAQVDLFPDETYFILFICVPPPPLPPPSPPPRTNHHRARFIFFALRRASVLNRTLIFHHCIRFQRSVPPGFYFFVPSARPCTSSIYSYHFRVALARWVQRCRDSLWHTFASRMLIARIFRATYKHARDVIKKYIWRRLASLFLSNHYYALI